MESLNYWVVDNNINRKKYKKLEDRMLMFQSSSHYQTRR